MQSIYLCLWVLFGVFILSQGRCDKGAYEYGVNDAEKNYIVNEHNRLRLLIAHGVLPGQPRGINLKRLSWDNNLATAAQNIANTCVFGHVPVSDPRWAVGQNIYVSYNKKTNWATGPINNWWNEYKKYTFGQGFSLETGHYTQMAWDDTQYVGCGYIYFPDGGQYKDHKIYVCNYGPRGNYPRAPYKTGNSGCNNLC